MIELKDELSQRARLRILWTALLFACTSAAGQATSSSPTPQPAPPPSNPPTPPVPPPGTMPWRERPTDKPFLTDADTVKRAIENSSNPRGSLEDFRLSTEQSRRQLEVERAKGQVDRRAFSERLSEYQKSIGIYRDLNKAK